MSRGDWLLVYRVDEQVIVVWRQTELDRLLDEIRERKVLTCGSSTDWVGMCNLVDLVSLLQRREMGSGNHGHSRSVLRAYQECARRMTQVRTLSELLLRHLRF